MERLFSDDGLEREFVERGYTVVPLLDQGDIEVLSVLNESTTVPHSRDFHPATPDFFATTLSPDTDKRRQVSDGIAAIVHDRLRLVVPGYRICFATFVYKIARSQRGHVPLHQDW